MQDLEMISLSQEVRIDVLNMIYHSKSSHIGSCLSVVDILTVLYTKIFDHSVALDKCIISKGHASAAVYSILFRVGILDESLDDYGKSGSFLTEHVNHKITGVDFSTGSLGHGLSVACGIALAQKSDCSGSKTFVIVGDGDLNEGSTWEGIMFAAQQKLSNLVMIVDYNKIQSLGSADEIINLESLKAKFQAFNWEVVEVDGHNHKQIEDGFREIIECERMAPKVLIAHTIKGKGVSFMENNLSWHYKNPNKSQYKEALEELSSSICAMS